VGGTSSFTTAAANATITLATATNALTGAVTLSTTGATGNASLTNNLATVLAASGVGGNLTVTEIAASGGITFNSSVTAGGTLAASTVNGNITLGGGVTLTANGSGHALILQAGVNTAAGITTGGDFVNNSGGAALSTPTAGASWLVYTGDVNGSGTTVGGLSPYTERYDTASSFVPGGTGNYIFYRAAPTLVVAPNAVSTIYNGATLNNATYSDNLANYTITGFVNGDTVGSAGVTLGGIMAFNGSTATAVKNAGIYSLTQGSLALNNNLNYSISFSNPTPNSYVITPAALSVIANAQSKVYGSADPALTYAASGFQLGDTAGSVLTGALTRAPGETVAGPYAITQGTLAANSNYTLAFTGNVLTITPAVLTYVADEVSRNTNSPNPPLSGTVTGFVNGETLGTVTTGVLTFATPANAASPPGRYAIDGSGLSASSGNYVFAQAPGNATALTIMSQGFVNDPLLPDLNTNDCRIYGYKKPLDTVSVAIKFVTDSNTVLINGTRDPRLQATPMVCLGE
ncbi:MAG TPA: MBG domain-containing protein, partial [Stellaceae bacterium]|nr:MBG domain-containing protein [Stellaceae bacterium]